jgi:hypothetical protein
MNYLQQRNLECFLAWQEKYRREYVEHDPWAGVIRYLTDGFLEQKRRIARDWLATQSARWRKKDVAVVVKAVGEGSRTPRYIWTARSALKKEGS